MPDRAGTSLGAEAVRRLLRTPSAVVAAVVLLIVGLACGAAPWTAPDDPSLSRPWLRATPPGSSHPEVLPVNRFVVGAPAETAARLLTARHLELTVTDRTWTEYQARARDGMIDRLASTLGAREVPRLDLTAPGLTVLRRTREGTTTAVTTGLVLELDGPAPETLFPGGEGGIVLRVGSIETPVAWTVRLAEGRVEAIARAGTPVASAEIAGEQVQRVLADGRSVERRHWLGTDGAGRDLLSRVLHGGRISLTVGLVATLVSLLIGVAYGAMSGWLGGRADRLLMAAVDILYGIPFLFLVILLLVNFGRNIVILFAALGAVQWLTMARIVRAQVLGLKHREFVQAAILAGCGPLRLLARHIVPNCLGPVVVYATLTVPVVILEESFLTFIGLQVTWDGTALDSWGSLVDAGTRTMAEHPWLLWAPAGAMVLTLLALNVLGDALRDALDVRLRGRG